MVINFNMYFASEWVIRHFRSSYVCNPLKKSSMLKFMLIYTFMKIHPGSVYCEHIQVLIIQMITLNGT